MEQKKRQFRELSDETKEKISNSTFVKEVKETVNENMDSTY